MRNIKLVIEYDGTDFVGWQRQPNGRSIQEAIEKTLANLLQEEVNVIGSGRTDSGVHARGQVANFRCNSKMNVGQFQKSFSALLPEDICIHEATDVDFNFHARYAAKSREYSYSITTKYSALRRRYSWFVKYNIDKTILDDCANIVLGIHDFEGFCKLDAGNEHFLSNVVRSEWKYENTNLIYEIEANRFLYGMVRGLVGTMVDVARGYRSLDDFRRVLIEKVRAKAGTLAPPHGLTLENVKY